MKLLVIAGLVCSWTLGDSLNCAKCWTSIVFRKKIKLHSADGDGTGIVCRTCGVAVNSRGKLFDHLRGTPCGQGLELPSPKKRFKVALIVGYTCGGEHAEDTLATCLADLEEAKTTDAAPRIPLTRATDWRFRSSPFFRYDR